jgi:ATP-dependent DNA helicase RecQ
VDSAALADVPGVGPALAERLGGIILRALGNERRDTPKGEENPLFASLAQWRMGVAQAMGVPNYVVIPDGVLHAIASARPESRLDLARIRGVGPRTLAKFGEDLLNLLAVRS